MDRADHAAIPATLAPHYSRFRVAERLLLTGHSHQAWPDCGFLAQQQAWLDAAEFVDDKWPVAFAKADEVRRGYARLFDDPEGDIALGTSTHELLVRLLSALPLAKRPRLVSTDGEFHSIRRLLDRLAEEAIEIIKVPAHPVDQLAGQLCDAVNDKTAAVLVSSVLYESAQIIPGLVEVAAACARHGAELVIDAYHHLNVVPFSLTGLESAYILGGGYKYCQLGEGNCALRLPKDCTLRPVATGWFSEFDALTEKPEPGRVAYGRGGHRFAGATYDPTSHYRAAAVFQFFRDQGLTPAVLRALSQHQVSMLADQFDRLDLDPAVICRDRNIPVSQIGGFLVLRSPRAGEICANLKSAGVMTDHRGTALRLGPAPYLTDSQLIEAMSRLAEVCQVFGDRKRK